MNLSLRGWCAIASVGIVAYGVSLRRGLGISAQAAGRYHQTVGGCACKSVSLIAHRADSRIADRTMRIFLVLTCGILIVLGRGNMACVFRGVIVAMDAGFVPAMLSAVGIYPVAIGVRTVRGAGGNRGTAVFTDDFPRAAGRPLFLRGGMRTIPERIQRHTCVCSVFPAGLILRTGHEFVRCPALEGITRAAGRYRRQRQRDIFGFGLTARRTASAVCVIRHRIGCRCVFLPYSVKGTIGICIIPFSRLIRCACR